MFACVALVVGLFSVVFAQAYLVKSQQQLDGIRAEVVEAKVERSRIQRQVDAASAPQAIIDRADELGMIPAGEPTHLSAIRPVEPTPSTPQVGDTSLG